MAAQLIQRLRPLGFECIVAPYEADAQLAYLSLTGYVSAVISEDSDLLVYGCEQVLYKLDSAGHGSLIRLSDLSACTSFDFRSWSSDRFCWMCVLSGCDYLSSLKSIGLRSAYRIALRSPTRDQVPVYVRSEVVFEYDSSFEVNFYKAVLVFRHQRVYDPNTQAMVHLTPLSDQDREMLQGDTDFLGPLMEPGNVKLIAEGKMDPMSMELFEAEKQSVVVLGKRARPQCTIETYFQPIKRGASRATPRPTASLKPALVEQDENAYTAASPFFSQGRQDEVEVKERDQPCISLLPKLVPLESPALSAELLDQLGSLAYPGVVKVRTGLRAPA